MYIDQGYLKWNLRTDYRLGIFALGRFIDVLKLALPYGPPNNTMIDSVYKSTVSKLSNERSTQMVMKVNIFSSEKVPSITYFVKKKILLLFENEHEMAYMYITTGTKRADQTNSSID